MKKKYILISFITIIFIFSACTIFVKNKQMQDEETIIKYNLNQVQSCFTIDYNKMDNDTKIFYYIKATSNLHTVLYILDSNRQHYNEDLFSAIYELYWCMSEDTNTNSRWNAVTAKQKDIANYLHYISNDINDKANCKALSKIANDLRQ